MAGRTYQQDLIEVLPTGIWLFREMVTRADQERMRDELRDVAVAAPFTTPQMPGNVNFHLRLTNAGEFGWTAISGVFQYFRTQPVGKKKGDRWPSIPPTIMEYSQRAALDARSPNYEPNACLVNYYDSTGELGHHRDDTKGEDFTQPIVTISLGDTARFVIGGLNKFDNTREVEINSGDILVMAGHGRMLYHSVKKIIKGSSDLLPKGGRISATLRRVNFNRLEH